LGNPSFLTRIEQVDPDLQTFAVVDWLPLGGDDSGGALISDAVDTLIAFDGYDGGFAAADSKTLEIAALKSRPTYESEDWLSLMSTDHGRRDNGGHGGDSEPEKRIFFLANGPAIGPGELPDSPEIVDVAVSALLHLGIEIDPAWTLDGKPILKYRD